MTVQNANNYVSMYRHTRSEMIAEYQIDYIINSIFEYESCCLVVDNSSGETNW